MNRSEETAQKHICRRPSDCLHFNGSNSNKQYNWLPIVLLLFKQTMTSGTRDSMKYIRRGEEGVRASDLGPSENQASCLQALSQTVIMCFVISKYPQIFQNAITSYNCYYNFRQLLKKRRFCNVKATFPCA